MDEQKRLHGSKEFTGKNFTPVIPSDPEWLPRTRISRAFSYDHNACKPWYDKWLSNGGELARDCVRRPRHATSELDLRDRAAKERWERTQERMDDARIEVYNWSMRRAQLAFDNWHPHEKPILRIVK